MRSFPGFIPVTAVLAISVALAVLLAVIAFVPGMAPTVEDLPVLARGTVADPRLLSVTGPKSSPPWVALTFDDGPDPRYTPAILDILDEENIHATFFVVGKHAAANEGILLDSYLRGHEIANHTWSHAILTGSRWTRTVREIAMAQDTVAGITGYRTRLFRPPKGMWDADDVKAAKAMGYKIVMWNACIENRSCTTPDAMVRRVMGLMAPHGVPKEGIILLHDGLLDRSSTVAALPLLIAGLREKGYVFRTAGAFSARISKSGAS